MNSDQYDCMGVPTSFTVAYIAVLAVVGVVIGIVILDPEWLLALA